MATIKAREICVIGSVNGNVEASDKVDIRKDAKLVGDIRTARIEIQDGAYFKGNIDIGKLDALVRQVGAERIPYVCVAVTVNLAGGQPVSMQNMLDVWSYCRARGIKVMLDATRAVENAWFIQQREIGMRDRSVAEILRMMCDLSDGATMSGKKDSLVNIGGWLGLRDEARLAKAQNLVVVYEGLHTYGGEEDIRSRIGQVYYLGKRLQEAGVPIVTPIGGHAVFLDAAAMLPHLPRDQFPAQALAAALYVESGVRAMERGAVSAGRDPRTGANRYPKLELVRLTIPRRVYTQAHMDVVAESVIALFEEREHVHGLQFTHEPEYLRFFQAKFAPVGGPVVLDGSAEVYRADVRRFALSGRG